MNSFYATFKRAKLLLVVTFSLNLPKATCHGETLGNSITQSNDWNEILVILREAVGRKGQAVNLQDYEFHSLGSLPEYGLARSTEYSRYETIPEASRRILAAANPKRATPEEASRRLRTLATQIELAAQQVSFPSSNQLKLQALMANFHATRIIAAIRYNLFKRGLNLGELYAATVQEREAVSIWRKMTALGGNTQTTAKLKQELKILEKDLAELEGQCCPPTPAILQSRIWNPNLR